MENIFTKQNQMKSPEGLFYGLYIEAYRPAGRQELEGRMADFESAQKAGETDSIDEAKYIAVVNVLNAIGNK